MWLLDSLWELIQQIISINTYFLGEMIPLISSCRMGASGSGSVESQVKQIGFCLKITGASWNSGNVPQVLRHRCAYPNGSLF